jgi:hypothetical protein
MLKSALLVGGLLLTVVSAVPRLDFIETSFYIVSEDRVAPEDAYVIAEVGRVEGLLQGDLTIAVYRDLTISGTVAGDVTVASGGTVEITPTGHVQGALRAVARSVVVDGRVDADVAVATLTSSVSGSVGRDVVGLGGSMSFDGEVSRDLKGWFLDVSLDGAVGNDVDVRVRSLVIGTETAVGGDLLYRADRAATAADGFAPDGTFARLPTRAPFAVRIVLSLLTILGLVAFLLIGLAVLWISRVTAPRAAGAVITRPWWVLATGLGVVVAGPLLMWGVVALIQPFVAKVAIVVIFALGVAVAVIFGPIPALASFGAVLVRHRGGIFGGFVAGVVVWRLVARFVPFAGLVLSLGFLVWGVGGWIVAMWDRRSRTPVPPWPAPAPGSG